MNIRFLAPAEIEMLEAAIYYEMQAPNLGENFLVTIEASITEITEYPETWPKIDKGIRKRVVHHFPYSILYLKFPVFLVAVIRDQP